MRPLNLSGPILGVLLLCCGGLLDAADTEPHGKRVTALRKQASEMAEQGNIEQAVKLLEAAAEPYEEATDEPGIERELQQGRERLQNLLARQQDLNDSNAPEAERILAQQQIALAQRDLQVLGALSIAKSDPDSPQHAEALRFDAGIRQIHHLLIAAQNLRLAVEPELANQTIARATTVQQGLQAELRQLAAEMQSVGGEHSADAVQALRAEIERLRAEVKELRQQETP